MRNKAEFMLICCVILLMCYLWMMMDRVSHERRADAEMNAALEIAQKRSERDRQELENTRELVRQIEEYRRAKK